MLKMEQGEGEFYLKATRAIIEFLNLFGDLELPGRRRACRRNGTRLFVALFYFVYLYCNFKIILSLWFCYKHDFLVHDHKKLLMAWQLSLSSNCEESDCSINNFETLAADQVEQIKRARMNAKLVGAPYLELAFASELALVALTITSFYAIIIPRLYFNHVELLKSELLCKIIDEIEGQKWVDRMVMAVTQTITPQWRARRLARQLKTTGDLTHKPIEFQLEMLDTSGQLQPTNRGRTRLLSLCRIFCNLILALGLSQIGLGVFIMFGLTRLSVFKLYRLQLDPMDLLMMGEIFLLLTMSVLCMALYLAIVALNLMDQIFTATHFTKVCLACVASSELSLFTKSTGSHQDGIDQMDRNLIDVIVKFKLFREQTKGTLPFNGFFVFLSASLSALGVILAYAHAIYVERNLMLVIIALLVMVIVVVSVLWIPTCYMYSRGEDIYRALYSLMAHTTRIKRDYEAGYHPHLVDILHRELNHPEKLLDNFACHFLGVRFTYSDLLKYQFFYGLALMSSYSLHLQKDNRATSLFAFL